MRSRSAARHLLPLFLPLSLLLLAQSAAAVPFSLQVYQDGTLAGTYSESTTWLSCSQGANTTDCSGASHGTGSSNLMLDSWTLHLDNDPVVSGIVAVTNTSSSAQHFTLFFILPVLPISPSSLTSGSIQGGITDQNGDGATLSAPAGSSLYAAFIDGLPPMVSAFQTLYDDPTSLSAAAFDSASLGSSNFGFPSPPSLPGPAVNTSIALRLDFVLSGNDSASFTSNFVVQAVPEPTTGLLTGLGLAGLVAAQRRKA